jgi:hypothetical protein
MNKRVFFFHYNKPASRSANAPKMTVHYKGVCHIVDHINCSVSVHTHHNKNQPHVVLKGKANNIVFIEDVTSQHKTALIT